MAATPDDDRRPCRCRQHPILPSIDMHAPATLRRPSAFTMPAAPFTPPLGTSLLPPRPAAVTTRAGAEAARRQANQHLLSGQPDEHLACSQRDVVPAPPELNRASNLDARRMQGCGVSEQVNVATPTSSPLPDQTVQPARIRKQQ